jgi:arylsulfatase A-like enzyme
VARAADEESLRNLLPDLRIETARGPYILFAATVGAPAPTRAAAHASALNVLLVSIDSLRADHLSAYGYRRPTSPAIDALASEGVRFDHAVSQAPWTLPAHASLLTSLYPGHHGADSPRRALDPNVTTLASILAGAGYAAHAVVSGPLLRREHGLDVGFHTYDDALARTSHRESHSAVTSGETLERALALLETTKEPFLLFLHFWDVHYDYRPPPPYDTRFDPGYTGAVTGEGFADDPAIHAGMAARDREHLIALYDGEIAWVDAHVARLLEALSRRGLAERTIVALTADHGDEFFEHGAKGHQHALYEELLHVPLILRSPRLVPGSHVPNRVELIDVVPTLLDLAAVPAPAGLQGRSLVPLLRGEPWHDRPSFAETTRAAKPETVARRTPAWAVYAGADKLISFARLHTPELYRLAEDPHERNNLYPGDPAGELERQLRRWRSRAPRQAGRAGDLPDDALEALRALGYLNDREN